MKLTATEPGWLLTMDEGRVQRIEVDFRLGLFFGDNSGTASLYIETPCSLSCKGQNIPLTPGDAPSLAPALALFYAEITDVTIHRTGNLTVRMKDGRSLEVDPNEQFEAWQIGSANGFLLVCVPGGEVTFFHGAVKEKRKEDAVPREKKEDATRKDGIS